MKLKITLIASSLLFVACKHEEAWMHQVNNEKRTTSAEEIHQKIPGTWMFDTQSDGGNWLHLITLNSDGKFSVVCSNETEHIVGTWQLQEPIDLITNESGRVVEERQLQDHGSDLVVTIAGTNHIFAYHRERIVANEIDIYPVIYVDARELILAPGFSVAGRYRFTR